MTAQNADTVRESARAIAARIDPTHGSCQCWEMSEGHWCDYCYDLAIQALAALEVAGYVLVRPARNDGFVTSREAPDTAT